MGWPAIKKPEGITWLEDLPYKTGDMVLDAQSFEEWVQEFLRWSGLCLGPKERLSVGDRYELYMRPLPRKIHTLFYGEQFAYLSMQRWGRIVGRVRFTDVVHIPVLREVAAKRVWMSLTPSEIVSQRPGLRKAHGRVIMGGLGMGWLARRVLERKQVEELIIYEVDADIIQTFGKPLTAHFGSKVRIIQEDVWDAPVEKYDSVLLDIWDCSNEGKDDPRTLAMTKRHPRVWAWN